MATKKVRINSMQEVIDLCSIGVTVRCTTTTSPVNKWSENVRHYWREDQENGHEYYIEVEDSEDD